MFGIRLSSDEENAALILELPIGTSQAFFQEERDTYNNIGKMRILYSLRPRSHECVFKSLRFRFTENAMKVLRPHDHFQILLPVHTILQVTENATNLALRMSRKIAPANPGYFLF